MTRTSNIFRRLPLVVAAFQLTSERRESNVDWPEWLHKAWNKNPVEPGAVYPAGYPFTSKDDNLRVMTEHGERSLKFGDWIVQGVRGELYPMSDEEFSTLFEPVEDAVAEDAPTVSIEDGEQVPGDTPEPAQAEQEAGGQPQDEAPAEPEVDAKAEGEGGDTTPETQA